MPYFRMVVSLSKKQMEMLRHVLHNATSSADEELDAKAFKEETEAIKQLRAIFGAD